MTVHRLHRIAAMALTGALLGGAPALALQCPTPQPGGQGVIQETSQNIAALAVVLRRGDLDNRIPEIVAGLKARHPRAGAADIVDYLVAAYCPVVNDRADMDDADKRMRLTTFSSQVFAIAFR